MELLPNKSKNFLKRINFYGVFLIVLLLMSCTDKIEPYSFVQICDPQLGMGEFEKDKENLLQAVKQINEMDIDFAVICGDLVHHAADSTFEAFRTIRSQLNIPSYVVPGNHDTGMEPNDKKLAKYREMFGDDYYSLEHKGTSLVFVNAQLWKSDIGEETEKHDVWFKETLEQNETDKAIVVGHIPIYLKDPGEEENYSNLPTEKRPEILSLMEENRVVAYLSGHRHEFIANNYEGIQLVTGESTSKNFDKRPFGFREWHVTADTLTHKFVELEGISE